MRGPFFLTRALAQDMGKRRLQALTGEGKSDVGRGLARGTLAPVMDRTFDISEIVEVHRHLESNNQPGKVVITTALADL